MTALLSELRRRDALLFWTGALMATGFIASALASVFDTRLILGLNPWIKPMKFFMSVAIFLWSVSWFLPEARLGPRTRAIVRWIPAITMVSELALIAGQSWRGTTSHFNASSPVNAAIFTIMGVMITVNSLAMTVFWWNLRRDTPSDRAGYLWGIRVGVALFVLASFQGFVIVANNAHTVGAPDGGPGLPFVNWSTRAGDLRIAHFIGMHALQALPLLGYLLDRFVTTPARTRRNLVTAAGIAWIVVMGGLLVMAMQGRPLIAI